MRPKLQFLFFVSRCVSFRRGTLQLPALGWGSSSYAGHGNTGLLLWLFTILLSFIMTALNAIGFMALGNKRGTILFIFILVVFAIGYVIFHFNVDIKALLHTDISFWFILTGVLAILLNIAADRICLFLYDRHHS